MKFAKILEGEGLLAVFQVKTIEGWRFVAVAKHKMVGETHPCSTFERKRK